MSMGRVTIDERVIAERVAEAVNRKLAPLAKEVNELKARVTRLEMDVAVMRTHYIETVIRSVLGVKLDEFVAKVSTPKELLEGLSTIAGTIDGLRSEIGGLADRVGRLPEAIIDEVSKELSKMAPKEVDLKPVIDEVRTRVSSEVKVVSSRIDRLDKAVGELRDAVSKIEGDLSTFADSVKSLAGAIGRLEEKLAKLDSIEKSMEYVRDVVSIMEERLRPLEEERERRRRRESEL